MVVSSKKNLAIANVKSFVAVEVDEFACWIYNICPGSLKPAQQLLKNGQTVVRYQSYVVPGVGDECGHTGLPERAAHYKVG
jgi:hypothetical protein